MQKNIKQNLSISRERLLMLKQIYAISTNDPYSIDSKTVYN